MNELIKKAKMFVLYESNKAGGYADEDIVMLPVCQGNDDMVRYALSLAQAYSGPVGVYVKTPELRKALQMQLGPKMQIYRKGQFDLWTHYIEIGGDKYKPIRTGMAPFDELIGGGLMRNTLVTLGAAPGAGKTTFIVQMVEDMALEQGIDTLYFHIEMDRSQILGRNIVRVATKLETKKKRKKPLILPCSNEEIMRDSWTKEQREAMWEAMMFYNQKIAPHITYYTMQDNPTEYSKVEYVARIVDEEVEALKAEGVTRTPIIVIDYLQLVQLNSDESDTAERIKSILLQLKGIALKHNTVVIVINANNRTSNSSGITTMEMGRDSSNIEYTADLMLGLSYRAVEQGICTQDVMRAVQDGGEIIKPEYLKDLDAIEAVKPAQLKTKLKNEYASFELKKMQFEEAKAYHDQLTLKVLKGRGVGVGRVDLYFNEKAHLFECEAGFHRYNEKRDGSLPFKGDKNETL